MTISDTHNYIKVELDKTSSLSLPSFLPEELDYWFDEGVRVFVESRYGGNNPKKQAVEETQKRLDDLRMLMKNSTLSVSATSTTLSNSYDASLPSDYLHSLNEEVTISFTNLLNQVITKRVDVSPITQNTYSIRVRDPFSEHMLHLDEAKPLRLFYDDKLVFVTDGNYSVTSAYLWYLRKPITFKEIVDDSGTYPLGRSTEYNTEFSDNVLHEIIKLTANMMLENIESGRYKTHMQEVINME